MTSPEDGAKFSPEVTTRLSDGREIIITWDNCILNTFTDDRYNFLQIMLPDDTEIMTFIPDNLTETMLENNYPNYHRPLVPEYMRESIEKIWANDMAMELDQLLIRGELDG